ncbi:unnamed protein product [Spodoptera littoralis]|uniref:Uncharacterized protein n=1 Tax=Spodoptera littoralis TaxID=7109 RepID=A0A9P0N9F1_SPOLI|nr:unnamed protein product [Spodoptera littoralis]CAH1646225.1 unnamed protein product [Spodoptera littoralis]
MLPVFCWLTLLEIACILTPQLVSSNIIADFVEDLKTYRPYTRRPRPKNKPVGKRTGYVELDSKYRKSKKRYDNRVSDVTSTYLPPTIKVTVPEGIKTETPLTVNTEPEVTKTDKPPTEYPAKVKFNFDFSIKGMKKLSFTYEEPQIPNLEKPPAANSKSE